MQELARAEAEAEVGPEAEAAAADQAADGEEDPWERPDGEEDGAPPLARRDSEMQRASEVSVPELQGHIDALADRMAEDMVRSLADTPPLSPRRVAKPVRNEQ